ncbi:HEXXH motif domain-containing protein [Streptomyces gobiensis]|uniref:HEXXH motif domain-containing protein n=1 Tax=Streptomyces gobiensis TaxID=2875706 RepID=UPI001E39916B|nr:HEXXH motif domain-containing protein [Streptomyces gobiensis]UGY94487.1 hypothetical protein test1122_23980 [Streptomyces gobiensis]
MTRVPRHGLPPRHFDALAGGGGGAAAVAHLWDGERSYRLLLFDILMKMAADQPEFTGPLLRVDEAWELLVAAEKQSSVVTDGVLLLPETGLWLARTLRRLRDSPEPSGGQPPLWVDLGQLHAIAAACAIRTGVSLSLRVPARKGTVWLPSLGCATLPGLPQWAAVEVSFCEGTLTIHPGATEVRVPDPPGRTTSTWRVPHRISPEFPEGTQEVFLDDLSRYRIFPVEPVDALPEALSDEAVDGWAGLLREASALLASADPQAAEDVTACLRTIEPLFTQEPFRWHSATSGDGIGGLAASGPATRGANSPGPVVPRQADTAQFAAALTHEIQHSKLSALTHMYSLHSEENENRLYAPWRDDPRPLRGMLQGVYAFTGVARFWYGSILRRSLAEEGTMMLAQFEFALRRHQLLRVLPPLREDAELTPLGRRVVEQLLETVGRWQDAPVPPRILADAEQAADDHAVGWRLHHLVPDSAMVAWLVRGWKRRTLADETPVPSPPPRPCPAPRLAPDPNAWNLDSRAVLLRTRLMDPLLKGLPDTPGGMAAVIRGARPADLFLLTGDAAAALRLYQAEITSAHDSACDAPTASDSPVLRSAAGAWAGLRLALELLGGHPAAAQALLRCPELVRDVHGAIGDTEPADPVAVADWVGRKLAP